MDMRGFPRSCRHQMEIKGDEALSLVEDIINKHKSGKEGE